jgi:hypothetical protein
VWAFERLAHTVNASTQGSSPRENNTQSKENKWFGIRMEFVDPTVKTKEKNRHETLQIIIG